MSEELTRDELLEIIKPIHEGMMFAQAHTKYKRGKEATENLERQIQGLWQIRKIVEQHFETRMQAFLKSETWRRFKEYEIPIEPSYADCGDSEEVGEVES
jgi:hypothetical protein